MHFERKLDRMIKSIKKINLHVKVLRLFIDEYVLLVLSNRFVLSALHKTWNSIPRDALNLVDIILQMI